MHLSKLPVKQARFFRDTQKGSVHKTSAYLKKIFVKKKKIADVKIPDLSIENICSSVFLFFFSSLEIKIRDS